MISDHEVPLAIGVLKGISWVSTHYKSGLLLYNRVSSNYWAVSSGEKTYSLFWLLITVISIEKVYN